ncbi:MAG: UDP-apiose/xylose synthase [Verrucomicrobiales bacterium]|jgi:UDP-apiose/xylose synthase
MKVLLLGAGGFIGVNLTERLLADGVHNVTALDIHESKIEHLINNPDLNYLHLNISTDEEEVDKLVADSDVVVDLVAFANPALYVTDPFGVYDLNYTQNMKVVEQCRKHKKRLVQFSTCEVYGITAAKAAEQFGLTTAEHKCEFIEDETPLIMGPVKNHRWIYACAKQLLERVLDALGKSEDFKFSIIRPFNFVGPRIDYLPTEEAGNPRVFSHFMDSLLYGTNPIKLVDGGDAYRAYTYIDDAVDAIVRVVENKGDNCNGEIFNIGQPDNELQIKDMAVMMCDIFDEKFRIDSDPPRPEIIDISGEEFYGEGYQDCDRRIANIDKARNLLGWDPQYDIEAVITKTMEYFVNEYRKKQASEAPEVTAKSETASV